MKRREEQLELIEKPKSHGGARSGSGRKAKRGETTVMRVPVAYKPAIEALIAHLDETKNLTSRHQPESSEPLYIRSLMQKKQFLTFTVEGNPPKKT